MPKGFQKGDPRAVAAGKKGGKASGLVRMVGARTADYYRGYDAGWKASERWFRRYFPQMARKTREYRQRKVA